MPFRGARDTPLEHCHSQEWTRPRTSLRQPGPRSASSASTPPPPGSDSLFGGQRAPAEPLGPADSAPPPRTGQRGDAKLLMPQPVSVEAARAGRPAEGRRPGDRATRAGAPIPRPRNPEAGPGRGAGPRGTSRSGSEPSPSPWATAVQPTGPAPGLPEWGHLGAYGGAVQAFPGAQPVAQRLGVSAIPGG